MNKIKAIETTYKGMKFRSRLEARWAIFFDTLKVPYQYEYEGFELPSGRYLPDFDVGPGAFYFEVKGSLITDKELLLAGELAEISKRYVYIAHSGFTWNEKLEIYRPEVTSCLGMNRESLPGEDFFESTGRCTTPMYQHGLTLKVCLECKRMYASPDYVIMPCRMRGQKTCFGKFDTHADNLFQKAYRAAVGARFEFGDTSFFNT